MKLLIFFFIIFIIGICAFTVMHEKAHQEIYRNYGIESNIHYFKYFPNAVTIPESNCKTESCTLANNMNEVVGYHLEVIYFLVGFGFIFIMIQLYTMERRENEKDIN